MKRCLFAFAILGLLVSLAACGGGGTPIGTNPPPPDTTYAASSLNGTYVMDFSGQQPYVNLAFHATYTADGAGNISAGTIAVHTINAMNSNLNTHQLGSFTGTYTVTTDGRGAMALTPTGIEMAPFTLNFILNSSNEAQIVSLSPNFVGGGAMVKLDSTGIGTVTGTYAFQTTATMLPDATLGTSPLLAIAAGQLTINADGTITGVRDLAVQQGATMVTVTEQQAITGTYTTVQPGVLTAVLTMGIDVRHVSMVFTGKGDFYLLGSDLALLLTGAGTQLKKSSFTAGSLSGNSILEAVGSEYDSNATAFARMGLIGRMTSDGSSAVSGTSQHFVGLEPASLNEAFTAAYLVDAAGRAVLHVTGGPTIYLYLTEDNKGIFLAANTYTLSAGTLVPQAAQSFSKASLKGQFAISVLALPAFAVGQAIADGAGTVKGTMDFYDGTATHNNLAFTGTSTVNSDGSGQLTVTVAGGTPTTFYLYMIDTGHFVCMTGTPYPGGIVGVLQQ